MSKRKYQKADGALAKWLEAKGISREEMADALGITPEYVAKLCQAARKPSGELGVAIEAYTKGKVRLCQMIEDYTLRQIASDPTEAPDGCLGAG